MPAQKGEKKLDDQNESTVSAFSNLKNSIPVLEDTMSEETQFEVKDGPSNSNLIIDVEEDSEDAVYSSYVTLQTTCSSLLTLITYSNHVQPPLRF